MIRSSNQQTADGQGQISGINITPFTDVCLVLLIIFLVTAPTLTREKSVRMMLPKAVTATDAVPKTVTVHVAPNLQIDVNNEPVAPEGLMAVLKNIHDHDNTTLLVVKADENVPYQYVIFAIDTARQVGFDDFALATIPYDLGKPKL